MISVTHEQYCAIAFFTFLLGMFYTMKQMFPYPDEVKNEKD